MRLFIMKKNLIKKFAEELAYLQISADWWYYVSDIEDKYSMSSFDLDKIAEVRGMCRELGILDEVYNEAYKIYDFRNSGTKDYPDIELIKKLYTDFCRPKEKYRF